jgi:GNAT superfamily N-acetyltransferase
MPHPAATDPMWRLRSLHRAMPFDEFERTVPVRPGWKREYYDDEAHVRPGWLMVVFETWLTPVEPGAAPGVRAVREADRPLLRDLFLDAFRVAPEYADDPDEVYPANADRYLNGFFGNARGEWSTASRVLVEDGVAVAAAAIKIGKRWPILDCLMVRPRRFRQGLGTAVAAASLAALAADGHPRIRSAAKLANAESIAWHRAFGFAELPCQMVAESRWRCAANEHVRLAEHGLLTPELDAALTADIARFRAELDALSAARSLDPDSVFPSLE